MPYGTQGFGQGLATGFGLMDAHLNRRHARERAARMDAENTRRWDITNERAETAAGLNTELKTRQIQEYDLNQAADIYSGISMNPDGTPIDVSKLTPEQLEQKKGQLQQVINRTKAFRDILVTNPDVDPENPLADINFVMDQQTGQPSAMFALRMKDGTVKPLTQNRSSDPKDNVVAMPLEEMHNNMMSILGSRGNLGAARAGRIEAAKAQRKHGYDVALENVKAGHKKEQERIKAGGTTGGGLTAKALKDQQTAATNVLTNELGTFDEFGNFAISNDHVGNEMSVYGMGEVLASHFLRSGEAVDGREAATRAISTLKQIQPSGGGITYDRARKQWVLLDGSIAEDGKPSYTVLHADTKPTAVSKQAPAGKSARARTAQGKPPPPAAVAQLRAMPKAQLAEGKKQFDAIFGKGAADKALKEQETAATPPQPALELTAPLIPRGTELTPEQRARLQSRPLQLQ